MGMWTKQWWVYDYHYELYVEGLIGDATHLSSQVNNNWPQCLRRKKMQNLFWLIPIIKVLMTIMIRCGCEYVSNIKIVWYEDRERESEGEEMKII